ncbi:hypothetical protein Arub01_44520 [Actinomadura rubrobrunea]|uniref:Biotin carboxyl carrier protein of acetyl-CoA carboxylase n=1 Tax=Actinomadura rubrobrunea TaxID=115335 RepID=A0A9W6Q096_9ACTN|nr:acetyl-CoA carboxylase biotin carboxyl carrier protein [Actinomadura rubrobrunea]GLW66208.1 hypothetical protein Arub01_44520 [Actinomadura rubrobrunea]
MPEHSLSAAADDARRIAGNGAAKDRSRAQAAQGRGGPDLAREASPNGAAAGPSGNGRPAAPGAGSGPAKSAAGNAAAKTRSRNGVAPARSAGDAARGGAATRADWEALVRTLREEAADLVRSVPGPLARLAVRVGDCSVEMAWDRRPAARAAADADAAPSPPPAGAGPGAGARAASDAAGDAKADARSDAGTDEGLETCAAPLVGTFYRSPAPGEDPFVEVGDRVKAGQPVGIVEAMKLMNEIPAECDGEVVEVLVPDAAPVEFGQPLVRIRPDRRGGADGDRRRD